MESSSPKMDTASILESLQRLSQSLQEMDDQSSSPLGHYQEIPTDIDQSYQVMQQGAHLVHATSTKYTLMGKISTDEQEKIAQDLLRGCQLIATGALVICNDSYGCCRSTRVHAKRAARAVVATVVQLMDAFFHATDADSHILEMDNSVGAQKCGAVWQTCDAILNKKVPQGNRNAMRRDLFTWMMECNETMQEFQELLDRGPCSSSTTAKNNNDKMDEMTFEDFCKANDDEQYSATELDIAKPCVGLVKCSRGSINVALKASDSAGNSIDKSEDVDQKKSVLAWIGHLHDLARRVGEGMTDLGTLLYPTLSVVDIEQQATQQQQAILKLLEYVLDSNFDLAEDVTELATKIRAGVQARQEELTLSIAAAKS